MKKLVLIIIFIVFIASLLRINTAQSFFSDQEKVAGNSISVATEFEDEIPTPTPTESTEPEPTMTPTPTPKPPAAGDLIINELMWMGSTGNSDDEWIELRNSTESEIDLSGCQLTKWVSGDHEELMITIPNGKTILAGGFFLISHFDQANSAISVDPDLVNSSVVLVNGDLMVKLYKGVWTDSANLIDTADDGSGTPLAGVHETDKKSMERNDDPATGWHSCDNNACNDTTYWDTEGNNYGTPKATNL